jgi:hypothetical protein
MLEYFLIIWIIGCRFYQGATNMIGDFFPLHTNLFQECTSGVGIVYGINGRSLAGAPNGSVIRYFFIFKTAFLACLVSLKYDALF